VEVVSLVYSNFRFLNYINHQPSLQIVAFGLTGVILLYITLLIIDVFASQLLPTFAVKVLAATEELVATLAGLGEIIFS
jgi:hypothetical protein